MNIVETKVLNDILEHADYFLGPVNTAGDLVRAGILLNHDQARYYRLQGKGPAYYKIDGRYFYEKEDVLGWIRENFAD